MSGTKSPELGQCPTSPLKESHQEVVCLLTELRDYKGNLKRSCPRHLKQMIGARPRPILSTGVLAYLDRTGLLEGFKASTSRQTLQQAPARTGR